MPTVVQPAIPVADMTPLEQLVLSRIFEAEPHDDKLYLFSETGPSECFSLPIADVREAMMQSAGTASSLADGLAPRLAEAGCGDGDLDLDLSCGGWALILQDIVKRSRTIDYISVVSSYMCSRMRPDGFGDSVTVITGEGVFFASTHDMEEQLLSRARHGEPDAAPGHGVHVLARISEADVRAAVGEIVASDSGLACRMDASVTDDDIRAACTRVIAERDSAEERGAIIFAAALRALATARGRATTPVSSEEE
jgi:hypothetical protein